MRRLCLHTENCTPEKLEKIMAMLLAAFLGPFISSVILGYMTWGLVTGCYGDKILCGASMITIFAYPITIFFGTPTLLYYERRGYSHESKFIIIGAFLGILFFPPAICLFVGQLPSLSEIPFLCLKGAIGGAITAFITATIYFKMQKYLKYATGHLAIILAGITGILTGTVITYAIKELWFTLGNNTPFHYWFEFAGAATGALCAIFLMLTYLRKRT